MSKNDYRDAMPPGLRLQRVPGKCAHVAIAVAERSSQIGRCLGGKEGRVLVWILVLILFAIVIVIFLPMIFKIFGWNFEP